MNHSTNVEILGSNTQIKIMRYKEVMFFDMALFYRGSLENVAKSLNC